MTCLLACASAVGCGGTQGESPSDASTGTDSTQATVLGPADPDPCDASKAFEQTVLANFDNGTTTLAGIYATYVSFDATGTLFSGMDLQGKPVAATGIDPINCQTGYSFNNPDRPPIKRCGTDGSALHLLASGSIDAGMEDAGLTGWGMNVGIDLRQNCNGTSNPDGGGGANPPTGPCFFDATSYTGISFWAMLGPKSTAAVALATVSDENTAGQLGGPLVPINLNYPFNDLICGDPPCVAGQPQAHSGKQLCDPFGKAIGLVDHWEFYTIPFDEMRQKGYGLPESKIDLAHVLAFKVSLGKGDWDVWLDDISFYRPKTD